MARPKTTQKGNGESKPPPNQAMLNALLKIEAIQQGMQPQEDKNTQDYIREARSGGMYGNGPDR